MCSRPSNRSIPASRRCKAQLAKEMGAPAAQTAASQPETSKNHRKAENQHRRSDITGTLIANMERWRWLPRDLGNDYVVVNVPDYSLSVTDKGKQIWRTRIVVGKPGEMATPLLSETMKYLNDQSDLERAAVHYPQRVFAGPGTGSGRARTDRIEGQPQS